MQREKTLDKLTHQLRHLHTPQPLMLVLLNLQTTKKTQKCLMLYTNHLLLIRELVGFGFLFYFSFSIKKHIKIKSSQNFNQMKGLVM